MKTIVRLIIPICLLIQACNWFKETPEVGVVLNGHFKNKLYKKFDTAAYNQVFIHYLDSLSANLSNPNTLRAYYLKKNLNPEFVTHFYANGNLDSLRDYISRSTAHGFNPAVFGLKNLSRLLSELDANRFKSINEVYPVVAELELSSAESLIKYRNFMVYGSVNPRKIFSRYYINVKRPDSAGIISMLETKDLAALLKQIQPKSSAYTGLQYALAVYEQAPVRDEQAIKTIKVNLERLRWKLPEVGEEHVEVNIPDFSLTWFRKADTLIHMKVCVGGKREEGYEAKLKTYLKTHDLNDRPKNHETPLLFSKINSIQVNPIWNIPVSIAQTEIYYQASNDPYYLSNNNMKVYLRGKRVYDPDTIQWNHYSRQKLPFQFKQGSGDDNALGKFKFIFDNGSSIYLHDTNNRSAFRLSNRAISHGCVRLEKPLEFAHLLIRNKYQYDQLRMEVDLPPLDTTKMDIYKRKLARKTDTLNTFELRPKWFGVKPQVPLIINYMTAWEQGGRTEFRPDIYGLDEILWSNLRKFL